MEVLSLSFSCGHLNILSTFHTLNAMNHYSRFTFTTGDCTVYATGIAKGPELVVLFSDV